MAMASLPKACITKFSSAGRDVIAMTSVGNEHVWFVDQLQKAPDNARRL
jgi:hypothetical protein